MDLNIISGIIGLIALITIFFGTKKQNKGKARKYNLFAFLAMFIIMPILYYLSIEESQRSSLFNYILFGFSFIMIIILLFLLRKNFSVEKQ